MIRLAALQTGIARPIVKGKAFALPMPVAFLIGFVKQARVALAIIP